MIGFHPPLTFACELDSRDFQNLFADPQLIEKLKLLEAEITVGLKDFTDERAEVILRLNQAGIPVTAWLLLPVEQGYWFNLDNVAFAEQRYLDFLAWTKKYQLNWLRVGLDIEPDIRMIQSFKQGIFPGLRQVIQKIRTRNRRDESCSRYRALVHQIQTDGFSVESYQLPLCVDARLANSTLLEHLLGILDLSVDHEVLMTYSSFSRPFGSAIMWNYGRNTSAIGIGSTGGGVDLEGVADTRPINWDELRNDLLIAHRLKNDIFIFSLEGCLEQGYLDQIIALDWNEKPGQFPYQTLVKIVRKIIQAGFSIITRPWMIIFGLIIFCLFRRRNERIQKQSF